MTTHMRGEQATDIVAHMCQEVEKQVKTFEVRRTYPIKMRFLYILVTCSPSSIQIFHVRLINLRCQLFCGHLATEFSA
jgi:hypothetical protein